VDRSKIAVVVQRGDKKHRFAEGSPPLVPRSWPGAGWRHLNGRNEQREPERDNKLLSRGVVHDRLLRCRNLATRVLFLPARNSLFIKGKSSARGGREMIESEAAFLANYGSAIVRFATCRPGNKKAQPALLVFASLEFVHSDRPAPDSTPLDDKGVPPK
jgi:hypothetical protein